MGVGGGFGNIRRVHRDRALQHHLELPSGIEKHSSAPAAAAVNEDQGDGDPGRRGGDSNPYGRSNM
jgi:hypothetical protein